jgi:multidrug efflux pump subunit AcrA (membrane-fusion protein)
MKVLLAVLLCLILFVAACSDSHSNTTQNAEAASAPAPISVEAAKVETRQVQRSVEAVGTLDPNEEVMVSNQVEGIVEKLFVDLGDSVQAGQLIAQIDTRELELNVHQQEAALQQELARVGMTDPNASFDDGATSQVRQAEAAFADAKIRLERTKRLAESGVIPQQQLDAQQAQFDGAEAALRSARETVRNIRATIAARKAALALAQKKLADAKIVAPLSGFIKERPAAAGQFLKANSPVVTIVQNSPLKLHADVPESAVAYVRAGRSVQFHVDAFPDRIFEGKITRLAPSVDQQSRTLKLEALVNNSDGVLKPGFFARVRVQTDRKDKVLVVPFESLVTASGIEKVFVIDGGRVTERIVRSGARLEDAVEIVDGLKADEVVARSNVASLQQGREVAVR